MIETIFREYDIRGIVGDELNIEQVYDFACALGLYTTQRAPTITSIFIGMDGRTHSPMIKEVLCKGLMDSGYTIIDMGVCPSPVLYFALHTATSLSAGVMVTASHNTKEYNGFKICIGTDSVWGKDLQDLRELFMQRKRRCQVSRGGYTMAAMVDTYIAYITHAFSSLKGAAINAVIDCANGAAGVIIPRLVQEMGWSQVTLLHTVVDGTYPNHDADPVIEHNMRDVKYAINTTGAQVGIGFDGDADRMAAMTGDGILVPGDQLLAVFACEILKEHPGMGVVCDIKSSSGLLELLEKKGAVVHMSASGHAIIKNQMVAHNALLAGELSCHFFFHDHYFGYDDGMYAMMRLIALLHQTNMTLATLLTVFPRKYSTREYRIPCDDATRAIIIDTLRRYFVSRTDVSLNMIDGIRVAFDHGWGLVRLSNTQPVISMRFEGNTQNDLEQIKNDFITVLQPYFMANMTALLFD